MTHYPDGWLLSVTIDIILDNVDTCHYTCAPLSHTHARFSFLTVPLSPSTLSHTHGVSLTQTRMPVDQITLSKGCLYILMYASSYVGKYET